MAISRAVRGFVVSALLLALLDPGEAGEVRVALRPSEGQGAGRMHGQGYIDEGGRQHVFEFRVRDRGDGGEGGRFQYWVLRPDHRADRFVSSLITRVTFPDDPPPRGHPSAEDTVVFVGTGRWNGTPGYVVEVLATDGGEPGWEWDHVTITIRDLAGAVVSSASGVLAGGNVQSQRR